MLQWVAQQNAPRSFFKSPDHIMHSLVALAWILPVAFLVAIHALFGVLFSHAREPDDEDLKKQRPIAKSSS